MASVYTVAQVTSYISHLFEEDFALKRISIQGEISNCKKHSGGHLYFTLKDELKKYLEEQLSSTCKITVIFKDR